MSLCTCARENTHMKSQLSPKSAVISRSVKTKCVNDQRVSRLGHVPPWKRGIGEVGGGEDLEEVCVCWGEGVGGKICMPSQPLTHTHPPLSLEV